MQWEKTRKSSSMTEANNRLQSMGQTLETTLNRAWSIEYHFCFCGDTKTWSNRRRCQTRAKESWPLAWLVEILNHEKFLFKDLESCWSGKNLTLVKTLPSGCITMAGIHFGSAGKLSCRWQRSGFVHYRLEIMIRCNILLIEAPQGDNNISKT